MDNHDQIFDLAAGLLPEDEARAAEAALSPEGRAELAAQRAVLAAIADSPPPRMTDIERAQLHRAVAAGAAYATREMPAVVPAVGTAPVPSARSKIWLRFASAAAAAAMLVGVVAVGSQLVSTSGDDASADPVSRAETSLAAAAAADLTTTTAAAFATDGSSDEDMAESAAGGDAAAEALPIDNAALWMLEEAPPLIAPPSESDLGELEDFASRMIETQRFNDGLSSLPCYQVAVEDDDLEIAASFRVQYPGADGEERYAIAFSDAGTATSEPLFRLYDPETCESLALPTDSQ